MIKREQVVEAAKSYIGVKFRMYGRDRKGVDCVGLLYCIGIDLGMDIEDFTDYGRGPEKRKIEKAVQLYTNPAPRNPPRTGQVLKLRQSIFPMHLGILVVEHGSLSVINANVSKKKVTQDTWQEWQSLVMEHREFKGVF